MYEIFLTKTVIVYLNWEGAHTFEWSLICIKQKGIEYCPLVLRLYSQLIK